MAVLLDAATTAKSVAQTDTTLSGNHTVAVQSNRLMVAVIQIRNDSNQTVSSITYNGVAFTFKSAISNGTNARSELWYLIAPATGTNNFTVTLSAGAKAIVGISSWYNVNQTIPLRTAATATGADTAPTVTVTSVTNDMVIDSAAWRGASSEIIPTPGAGQTQIYADSTVIIGTGDEIWGASSYKAGAASVTMSWSKPTASAWAMIGISIVDVNNGATTYSETMSGGVVLGGSGAVSQTFVPEMMANDSPELGDSWDVVTNYTQIGSGGLVIPSFATLFYQQGLIGGLVSGFNIAASTPPTVLAITTVSAGGTSASNDARVGDVPWRPSP